MEIANAWLKLTKTGSDVFKRNITPPEAVLLRLGHEVNAGGNPLSQITITGKLEISSVEERMRLASIYPNLRQGDIAVIDIAYPGTGSQLPQTFKDAGFEAEKGGDIVLKDSPMPVEDVLIDDIEILVNVE